MFPKKERHTFTLYDVMQICKSEDDVEDFFFHIK